jgi:hypothetical protein
MSVGPTSPFLAAQSETESDGRFQPETPFLDTRFAAESWGERESPVGAAALEQEWAPRVATPFLSEYHGESPANLEAQVLEQTLTELFDRDFNEAVSGLAMEAAAQAEQFGDSGEAATAQMLHEWLDPLRRATERLFEQAGEAATQQRVSDLGESELESLLESAAPQPGVVAPEFEDFLQRAWKKVKRIAQTAASLAKKGAGALAKLGLPIGALLKKLSRLVRPLLNRVVRFALGRLPAGLRPAARLLGRRLGILTEATEAESEQPGEAATTPEAETIAHEFDTSVATLLFARDEGEGELLLAEAAQEQESPTTEAESTALGELDAARERFVGEYAQLQSGENPGPAVQQFVPAILPLLRVGITVVGRQRVVKFLAGHLARLIQSYVGREAAAALSSALVDVGLRMITLEAETEPPPRLAGRVVAATLEDAVRRVAAFGVEQFDNLGESLEQQQLLESVTNEAFFQAAVAHFPPQLLDGRRLEEREMYFEASNQPGTWVYRPRPRYKKYTRVFEVAVTPQLAARLRSFGNQPLDAFLRSRGVRLPATLKVHLYEAIPGTTLSRISQLERRVPGLGSGKEDAWSKIHPLTTEAAGLLLREPALGRDVDARWLASRHRINVGQRFYYLEVGQSYGPGPGAGAGTGKCLQPSEANITVDLRASQVRVSTYFSEADAQRVVAGGPGAGAMTAVRVAEGLGAGAVRSIASGPTKHVTFIREATGELEGEDLWQRVAGEAAKRIGMWLLEELGKALLRMLKAALVRYFNTRAAEFATATRNPACGVTLVFTFNHPGLRVLHAALAGRVPNMSDARAAARAIQLPSAAIVPGFTRR